MNFEWHWWYVVLAIVFGLCVGIGKGFGQEIYWAWFR